MATRPPSPQVSSMSLPPELAPLPPPYHLLQLATTLSPPLPAEPSKSSPLDQLAPSPLGRPSTSDNTNLTGIKVGIPIAILSLLIAGLVGIYRWKGRKPRDYEQGENKIDDTRANSQSTEVQTASAMEELGRPESLQYDLETIKTATSHFSEENMLGRGGFGVVYKGTLANGQRIAVKRLSSNSMQGEAEFKNEVLLLTKLQHRNLVRLLGFCLENNEKLLIYEFVPNASLDQILFAPMKRFYMDWETRFKIIEGIARGLQYLHQDSHLRIVHRDLKTSNILLDTELNPKISDFGLARLFLVDETQAATSKIMGTYGYMAPEYAMHGHFSIKSDVYSFGVLVLEIISGRRNTCGRMGATTTIDLLSFAWKSWRESTASHIIDPALCKYKSQNEILRCIQIGLLCVQENIAQRPIMSFIIAMLTFPSVPLLEPFPPAAFSQMTSRDCYGTSSTSTMNTTTSSREVTPSSDESRHKNVVQGSHIELETSNVASDLYNVST